MALKLDYLARETTSNLRRNLTLTLASVVTVAVSLALVGSAFVVRAAVQHSTARWKGDVQFIVFMNPTADKAQIDAVASALDPKNNPQIKRVKYLDKPAAYAEFRDIFRDDPVMLQSMTEQDIPTSFRVSPSTSNPDLISQTARQMEKSPGVFGVTFGYDTVKKFERLSGMVSAVILGTAVFLLGAAGLLILNTIRMAMFARRREIEVMKLVGATNWFIRIPFMLEGLVQGLAGAIPAVGAVYVLYDRLGSASSQNSGTNILQGLTVTSGEVLLISVALVVVGALVGVVGSGIAVTRFLDV